MEQSLETPHIRPSGKLRSGLLGIVAGFCLFAGGPAEAVSSYTARATAVLGLTTTGSFDDLLYLGSEVRYSAHAEVISDGVPDRMSVIEPFVKSGTPVSFGSLFAGGDDLADIFLNTSTGRHLFADVTATSGGAHAEGASEGSSPGADGGRFSVTTSGFATDPVELANSRVFWDFFVSFQDTSDTDLAIEWTLTPALRNEARADPRGSAFSESRIRTARGTFANGGRVFEPNIFKWLLLPVASIIQPAPWEKHQPIRQAKR